MTYWKVVLTEFAEAGMQTLRKKKVLSDGDVKVLIRWMDEMEQFGPAHIASSLEWHDHELGREWVGFRSSAFSAKGRIIYRIDGKKVTVLVYRVTVDHNYKK